jgi:hypothetical protein
MRRREADAKGAIEEQMTDLEFIDPIDVLGYHGRGREEHSGENSPAEEEETDLEPVGALPS